MQKLKKEIKRLKALAYKDELTDLYSRRGFKEEAKKFFNKAVLFRRSLEKRKSFIIKSFSLVIFDIDDFKKINDTYGHEVGDRVLKILSRLILERIRDIDLAARWGGDEIVLGLVGASMNDAFKIANDIRERVAKLKFKCQNKAISFTLSGGVAGCRQAKTFNDLFNLADKALYKAKKQGKNKIVC